MAGCAQAVEGFDAVESAQHDVEDDQVRGLVQGGAQGAWSVGLLGDGGAARLQVAPHDLADLGLVDDENGGLVHGLGSQSISYPLIFPAKP